MKKGKLISICGIDGSGKTTQSRLLNKYLDEKGFNVFHLPKMPSFGGWIIDCLKGEYESSKLITSDIINLVEISDRIRYLTEYCEKILNYKDTIIISERYTYSYIARAITQQCNPNTINVLKVLYKACLRPDMTIFLDVSPKIAVERVETRGYDSEDLQRLINLDNAYKTLGEFSDFQVINAEHSIDVVHKSIKECVDKKF